jgi:hypothetical protein
VRYFFVCKQYAISHDGLYSAKLPEIQRPASISAPEIQPEAAPQTFEPAPEQPAPIIPEQREKIAFGFGLKRKTEDPSANATKKFKGQ